MTLSDEEKMYLTMAFFTAIDQEESHLARCTGERLFRADLEETLENIKRNFAGMRALGKKLNAI